MDMDEGRDVLAPAEPKRRFSFQLVLLDETLGKTESVLHRAVALKEGDSRYAFGEYAKALADERLTFYASRSPRNDPPSPRMVVIIGRLEKEEGNDRWIAEGDPMSFSTAMPGYIPITFVAQKLKNNREAELMRVLLVGGPRDGEQVWVYTTPGIFTLNHELEFEATEGSVISGNASVPFSHARMKIKGELVYQVSKAQPGLAAFVRTIWKDLNNPINGWVDPPKNDDDIRQS